MTIPWLRAETPFPPTATALGPDSDAPGLLAAGGGLDPERLRAAYALGVFPWFSPGEPVLWWTPDPRMLLHVDEFRLAHSLRKTLRRFLRTPGCQVRFDHDTPGVIRACAGSQREGQPGTWIVPGMIDAYSAWSRRGDVHSVETWIDGELIGGLYGVNLGRMMFGESMFSRRTDASKIALAALVAFCRRARHAAYRLPAGDPPTSPASVRRAVPQGTAFEAGDVTPLVSPRRRRPGPIIRQIVVGASGLAPGTASAG